MAKYLDLDDAVANVAGDVAKRELDELRRQRNELAEALNKMVTAYETESIGGVDTRTVVIGKKALANLDSESEQPKDDYDMTYDYNIHTNPDHEAWADFFIKTWPNGCADRDTMAGWFANAMMAKADSIERE